jgi:tRNA uridine 5-carbamoylmethylation protein Kti12
MLILKKILVWLKHHWYIPLAVVLGLVCLALCPMAAKSKYFQMLLNTRYNYRKEIDIINKNNELEKQKTMDAIERHQESLAKIEEDFNIKMDELPKKEKKRVEAIVKEYDNDPDKLAKEIADILGADNV